MGMPASVTLTTCRPRTWGTHSTPQVPSPLSKTTTSGALVAESGGRTRTLYPCAPRGTRLPNASLEMILKDALWRTKAARSPTPSATQRAAWTPAAAALTRRGEPRAWAPRSVTESVYSPASNQWQSVAISGNQALRACTRAISGNQWQSSTESVNSPASASVNEPR